MKRESATSTCLSCVRYLRNIQLVHATAIYVPLSPPANGATDKTSAADWTLNIEKLAAAITPKTKMIVSLDIVFSRDELLAIGNLCVKHSIMILSDEVYDRLYYVPFTRIATLSEKIADQTLTFGSIGKAFYCTGWRVGYVIGPEYLISHVCTAHTRICYAAPGPQQEAAAVGYEEGDSRGFWEEAKTDMKGKIDRFTEVLDELGLPYTDPQGGYFVLVNTKKIRIPGDYAFPHHVESSARDFKMSWWLAQELGVAAIPPSGFYSPENAHLAENYLRFAVCKNDDVLELAKARLRGLEKYLAD
ncbi:MAG: hypothetical protein LQ347_003107 [Umbilicaria vellea]|nr:MAG: hypothetical protein LQ347_003107 [Umbilicaria vellea]